MSQSNSAIITNSKYQDEISQGKIPARLQKAANETGLVTWVENNRIFMSGKTFKDNNRIGYNLDVIDGCIFLTVHTFMQLNSKLDVEEVNNLMSELNKMYSFKFTLDEHREIRMQYPMDVGRDLQIFYICIYASMEILDILTKQNIGKIIPIA